MLPEFRTYLGEIVIKILERLKLKVAAMAKPTTHEVPLEPKYDHYDFPTISATAQSGHAGHTTPEQDAKVHQLRTMLEQAGCKDRLDTLTMVCLSIPGETICIFRELG